MSIYIQLFHGRHDINEELDDWGFDGPILGPFPWFHVTYGCDVKLGDELIVVDGVTTELPVHDADGYIKFLGAYYGDISIISADTFGASPELIKRHAETYEAFKITGTAFGTHINDTTEWIKHYTACKLRGDI